MTKIHKIDSIYRPRQLELKLQEYLQGFSVVSLTGPRQSGKSTLLKHFLGNEYQYVSFDDLRNVEAFQHDPNSFINKYHNRVIFDEVQYVPQLFSAIKLAVDNDRANRGKFILTGSSQFTLLKDITESLAGRIGLLTLLPFQYSEMPTQAYTQCIFRGCYPELVDMDYHLFDDWFNAYITTYLERDVRKLHNIGNLHDFQLLIRLLAANTSQILDYTHYASQIGVSVSTIKRWISILEASYIIFLLPSYHNNLKKRLTKRPKIYFWDTGLVAHLTRIINQDLYENGPMRGSLFENFIVAEILKRELHNKTHSNAYFFRTSHGVEIDLIIERNGFRELIEVKQSATPNLKMANTIDELKTNKDKGFIIYNGASDSYKDIQFINYKNYLTSANPFVLNKADS